MAREPQSAAGGAFVALAIFIGAIVGTIQGQPTIGVLGGVAAGIVIAAAIWLRDRRRVGH